MDIGVNFEQITWMPIPLARQKIFDSLIHESSVAFLAQGLIWCPSVACSSCGCAEDKNFTRPSEI